MLSKSAAVAILNREPMPPSEEPKLSATIRENLSGQHADRGPSGC